MIGEVTWDYIYTMDPVPQQSGEFNKLHRFYDHLREGRLTTTRCEACGNAHWPPRTICPECVSDSISWVDLPGTGVVKAFTVQRSGAPPGFELPMIFAAVELENGLRFIARIIDADPESISVGQKVQFTPVTVTRGRVLAAFRPLV